MSSRVDGKGDRLQTYMKLQADEILRIAVGGMGRELKDTTFIFTPGKINGESGGGAYGSSKRDGGPGLSVRQLRCCFEIHGWLRQPYR